MNQNTKRIPSSSPWRMKIYLNPWHYWVVREVRSGFSIQCYGTNFLADPTLWIFLIPLSCFFSEVTTVVVFWLFVFISLFSFIMLLHMYISPNNILSSFVFFGALWKEYNTVHSPVKLVFLIQHFFLNSFIWLLFFIFIAA